METFEWLVFSVIMAGGFALACRVTYRRVARSRSRHLAFVEHALLPLLLLFVVLYLLVAIEMEADWVAGASVFLLGLSALLLLFSFSAILLLFIAVLAWAMDTVLLDILGHIGNFFSWLGVRGAILVSLALIVGDIAGYGFALRRPQGGSTPG